MSVNGYKSMACLAFALCMSANQATSLELSTTLREANALYESSNYDKAILVAQKSITYSPRNVQAMLIIGMSLFNQNKYYESKEWFRKVLAINKRQPIAKKYTSLLQEIEHKYGPFQQNIIVTRDSEDPVISGEAFKRGWLGSGGFPNESKRIPEELVPETMLAPIALEVDAPTEKILIEQTVEDMAKKAFDSEMYIKSYLFYSQLLDANPSNRGYLIGKASSAFHMKRYQEVIKYLGPIMLAADNKSFSKTELKTAQQLLKLAKEKVFSTQ